MVPITFAGAEISRTSSMKPTTKMTVAANSTPRGSVNCANNGSNVSINRAAPNAATKPMNIAMPPTSGVATVCTRRSSGSTTHPIRRATRPTMGVVTNVTTAAMAPITR